MSVRRRKSIPKTIGPDENHSKFLAMKRKTIATILSLFTLTTFADPVISDAKIFTASPWPEAVVRFTVSGWSAASKMNDVNVMVTDNVTGKHYWQLFSGCLSSNGVYDIKVNTPKFSSSDVSVSIDVLPPEYCVIDLSNGPSASNYPVSYLSNPPSGGFNTDEYKTTKLVMKRILPGTFIMGEDQTDETHRVTLTHAFYIGLFEVTQAQYSLVTDYDVGMNPYGSMYPVWSTYAEIRGKIRKYLEYWPVSAGVDSNSFMGKFRTRTGIESFDLPTEAQWEYACRAGTTTPYFCGDDTTKENVILKYVNARSYYHELLVVGSKRANPWGLYDMLGNREECCLDIWGDPPYGIDPKGPDPESNSLSNMGIYARVVRGGSIDTEWTECRSYLRNKDDQGGFRLSRTIQ